MERTDQQASTYCVKLATALGVSPQWLDTGSDKKSEKAEKVKEPRAKYQLDEKMLKRVEAIENASEEFQAGLDRMLGIDD
jgi:phage repressor protein C with HTH and peptisase S24 domain